MKNNLKMIAYLSFLLVFLVEKGFCVDGESETPCSIENIRSGRLYHAHPTDPRYYIQCSKFGAAFVRACAIGTVWNQEEKSCSVANRRQGNNGQLQESDPVCPSGQVYDSCGSACPTTCDQPEGLGPCILSCVAGCRCADGLLTVTNQAGNITDCITREQCPKKQDTSCSAPLVWNKCGSACNTSCEQPIVPCTKQCVPRCQCPDNTLQSYDINKALRCVQLNQCCPRGQVFNPCASACPESCVSGSEPRICTLQCVPKCSCTKNAPVELTNSQGQFVRCVARRQCPTLTIQKDPQCSGGRVWKRCGQLCTKTCRKPRPVCARLCVPKCQCPIRTPIWSQTLNRCIRRRVCRNGLN